MQKDEDEAEHDQGFIQELPLASFDPTNGNMEIFGEGAQLSKSLMDTEQELSWKSNMKFCCLLKMSW